ncbi:Retrovirus-related Pol polyprotein from transposon TNT 1-94 [Gossypium australe]|uniref:Retrovirus-related Pol polyprotein from transposon TNT 1-94 n=1 Tax=Gossypium australe TaxID=47621 RepID=A0A5B6VDW5_9ROSI|nr:Retrovirus-related Pol polyprotein from transposon TNT 1-94 [Gossypium australe]
MEKKISDQTIVEKVLRSLTPRIDHVVATIMESKDMASCSFDEPMKSLQSYEARLNRANEKSDEKAFQVTGDSFEQQRKSTYRRCYRGTRNYHGKGRLLERDKQANYAEDDEEIKLFMACQDDTIALADIWFLNNGYSYHMTGIKSLFKEIDESYKVKVRFGDDKKMQVEGKDAIAIK